MAGSMHRRFHPLKEIQLVFNYIVIRIILSLCNCLPFCACDRFSQTGEEQKTKPRTALTVRGLVNADDSRLTLLRLSEQAGEPAKRPEHARQIQFSLWRHFAIRRRPVNDMRQHRREQSGKLVA